MTKSKLPLPAITLFENRFNNEIDLNIQSSKTLLPGEIVHTTPEKLFINFNLKGLIEISMKDAIKLLSNTYLINKESYLNTRCSTTGASLITKRALSEWVKKKLTIGETINMSLSTIDSLKNLTTPCYNDTINLTKLDKLFYELDILQKKDMKIKGFIINSIKGGFSVAIGGLIAFLPAKELTKLPTRRPFANFINTGMYFKIAKINFSRKNIVLKRA